MLRNGRNTLFTGNITIFRNGLIVVNVDADYVEATLAHEWRHHWQNYEFGTKYDHSPWKSTGNHKVDIQKYFRSSAREMDALLYEVKFSPTEINQEWLNWTISK